MTRARTTQRRFLQLIARVTDPQVAAAMGADTLKLEFDRSMRSRARHARREAQRESLTPLTIPS